MAQTERWKRLLCKLIGHSEKIDVVFKNKDPLIEICNHTCVRCGESYGATTFQLPTFYIKENKEDNGIEINKYTCVR